jgi:hypothetical protein
MQRRRLSGLPLRKVRQESRVSGMTDLASTCWIVALLLVITIMVIFASGNENDAPY